MKDILVPHSPKLFATLIMLPQVVILTHFSYFQYLALKDPDVSHFFSHFRPFSYFACFRYINVLLFRSVPRLYEGKTDIQAQDFLTSSKILISVANWLNMGASNLLNCKFIGQRRLSWLRYCIISTLIAFALIMLLLNYRSQLYSPNQSLTRYECFLC